MIPIVTGALTAAKGAAVSSAVSGIAESVGSLFGGKTAKDRARDAEVAAVLTRALSGDLGAVEEMYQKSGWYPDGLPQALNDRYRKALRAYYSQRPQVAVPAAHAALLKIPERPASGLSQQLVQPVLQAVGAAAVDQAKAQAGEAARNAWRAALPWVVGVLVLGVVAVLWMRRR